MRGRGLVGTLAAATAVWVGATGAPLPLSLALLGAGAAVLAWAIPRAGGLGRMALQASVATLLLRTSLDAAGVPVLCAALVLCAIALRSRTQARLVVGLCWLEALRLRLLAATSAVLGGASLTWVGLTAGAASALGRRHGAWIAVGWVLLGLRGHQRVAVPLEGASQAVSLARAGLLDPKEPTLAALPTVGLATLGHLQNSALAHKLLPHFGPRRLLWAGWHPTLDASPLAQPAETVQALDELGRGGEALRLTRRGADTDPVLAWWAAVLAREQHVPSPVAHPPVLEGVPVLDPTLALHWTFVTEESRVLPLQIPRDLKGLRLETHGQHHEGAPDLRVEACGALWQVPVPEGRGEVALPALISAGPCRLRISLVGDRVGPGGDRNAVVLTVSGDEDPLQVRSEK